MAAGVSGGGAEVSTGGTRNNCSCDSDGYNGRVKLREMALATSAAAIRLNTIWCPSTISMTMIKAVKGA